MVALVLAVPPARLKSFKLEMPRENSPWPIPLPLNYRPIAYIYGIFIALKAI